MADESDADDGAMFDFWAFIRRRRRLRRPEFDLDDVVQLRAAIARFEAGDDS